MPVFLVPLVALSLLAETPPNTVEDLGYTRLFNGRDLSGWVVPEGDNGHWRVIADETVDGISVGDSDSAAVAQGVIDYDAASEASGEKNLKTERSFRDFVAEIEWRVKPVGPLDNAPLVLPDGSYLKDAAGNIVTLPRQNPDSGIYLRGSSKAQINIWGWPVGSGEMYGYRHRDSNPAALRAAVTPRVRADKPIGEWNRFSIVVVGRTVTVLLNDHLVIDRAELPEDFPEEGPLVLQHHGGYTPDGQVRAKSSVIQFRNIYIKELPTKADAAATDDRGN